MDVFIPVAKKLNAKPDVEKPQANHCEHAVKLCYCNDININGICFYDNKKYSQMRQILKSNSVPLSMDTQTLSRAP